MPTLPRWWAASLPFMVCASLLEPPLAPHLCPILWSSPTVCLLRGRRKPLRLVSVGWVWALEGDRALEARLRPRRGCAGMQVEGTRRRHCPRLSPLLPQLPEHRTMGITRQPSIHRGGTTHACDNEALSPGGGLERFPHGDQLPDRADHPRRGGGRRPAAADVGVHAERGRSPRPRSSSTCR